MLGNDLQFDPALLDDREAYARWMSDLVLQVNRVSNLRGDGQYISISSSQLSTSIKFNGDLVEEGHGHYPCVIISHSPGKPEPGDNPSNQYTYKVRRVTKRVPKKKTHGDEGSPSNEGYGTVDDTAVKDSKGGEVKDGDGNTIVKAKYGAWQAAAGTDTFTAFNFLENMNSTTDVQGNGVDRGGTSYPGGFNLQPAPVDAIVMVYKIGVNPTEETFGTEYWFQYNNQDDGTCLAP